VETQERINEVMNLRFALQSKSRMRLEFLGELSKILRIHGHSINDEVLSSLVLAVPEELPGQGSASISSASGMLHAESTENPAPRPPGGIDTERPPGGAGGENRPPGGSGGASRPPGDQGESRPPGDKGEKRPPGDKDDKD
jgi:hypothetical protein